MIKKTTNTEETRQPSYVEDLLKNGTAVLTAKTCEDLAEMVNSIPADVYYGAGAVGRNPETGEFSLRLDITNN
jgi:urease gamma subunit